MRRNIIPAEILSSKTNEIEKIEMETANLFGVDYYFFNHNGQIERTMSKNILTNNYN